MPLHPILKTKCKANYKTPTNTFLPLDVNCQTNQSDIWPWKYFRTQTVGTLTPVTTDGFIESDGSIDTTASFPVGQTVLRAIFAYVATDPFELNLQMLASSIYSVPIAQESLDNVRFEAILYNEGDNTPTVLLDEFFLMAGSSLTYNQVLVLPATVCPKILWLGAKVQPTGTDPLPATSTGIRVFE